MLQKLNYYIDDFFSFIRRLLLPSFFYLFILGDFYVI
jgi:hypothetical protein